MEEHNVTFQTVRTEEYLDIALLCYRRGCKLIEVFLDDTCEGEPIDEDNYVWSGMQTFHYCFYQRVAACYKRMGRIEDSKKAVDEAYMIISRSWHDFDEKRDRYMEIFNEYLREYDLAEYVK